jgi:hypothetical protein
MREHGLKRLIFALSCALTTLHVCAQLIPLSRQTIKIQEDLAKCRVSHSEDACSGFPARARAPIYKEPSTSSQVVYYVSFDSYIALFEPRESAAYPGWVSVASGSNNELYKSWMRQEDIVLASDLRRVVDCWPVQAINWDEDDVGDYAGGKYRLRFDKAGKILPRVVDGRVVDFDTRNFAIYYDRGVFLIAPHSDLNIERFTPFFVMDYPNKKLIVTNPVKKPSARFFPQEKLQGCKDIPTVDASAGMKFR